MIPAKGVPATGIAPHGNKPVKEVVPVVKKPKTKKTVSE